MSLSISARAATDRGARYAKQLASHLGRKIESHLDDDGVATIRMEDAVALLTPTAFTLDITVSGPDDTRVMRLVGVVVSHFERFGEKDGIVVEWDDAEVAAEYARRKAIADAERAERAASEAT